MQLTLVGGAWVLVRDSPPSTLVTIDYLKIIRFHEIILKRLDRFRKYMPIKLIKKNYLDSWTNRYFVHHFKTYGEDT